ncbi:hypothetical protein [Spiroplasma tabanidicola]|uniref:Lipoprotein n=1 Tax=Spiroplasma tabanidicola TaxID=324079 RepID=A0A6I6CC92_9MOLU|nr:hypothetical protein [Spiroplasma tabanidicola]QGS51732.1 hypothetical protein STABA_v1c03690 [Spiroplasma tabanidicola]
MSKLKIMLKILGLCVITTSTTSVVACQGPAGGSSNSNDGPSYDYLNQIVGDFRTYDIKKYGAPSIDNLVNMFNAKSKFKVLKKHNNQPNTILLKSFEITSEKLIKVEFELPDIESNKHYLYLNQKPYIELNFSLNFTYEDQEFFIKKIDEKVYGEGVKQKTFLNDLESLLFDGIYDDLKSWGNDVPDLLLDKLNLKDSLEVSRNMSQDYFLKNQGLKYKDYSDSNHNNFFSNSLLEENIIPDSFSFTFMPKNHWIKIDNSYEFVWKADEDKINNLKVIPNLDALSADKMNQSSYNRKVVLNSFYNKDNSTKEFLESIYNNNLNTFLKPLTKKIIDTKIMNISLSYQKNPSSNTKDDVFEKLDLSTLIGKWSGNENAKSFFENFKNEHTNDFTFYISFVSPSDSKDFKGQLSKVILTMDFNEWSEQ